jgi:hypothetical protein
MVGTKRGSKYQSESITFAFASPITETRPFVGWMTGRVALGNARWAVPKSAGRVSMEKGALGVAGGADYSLPGDCG